MNLARMASKVSKFAVDNSPSILTTIGVVGTVTTAYLAGKASFEAANIINLKEGIEGTPEDPKEQIKQRVQLVWKLYIPAATMGTATIACIIGANRIGTRRAAGMAAAYTIAEKTLGEYKNKVVEKFGERKEEQVRTEIMQDRVNDSFYEIGDEVYGAEAGELCYDKFCKRYFRSTVEGIRSIQNDFNHSLLHDGYMSLAEFYRMLDIPAPSYTEHIGWNADRLLDVKISSVLTPTSKPCIAIEFREDPISDYGRFR